MAESIIIQTETQESIADKRLRQFFRAIGNSEVNLVQELIASARSPKERREMENILIRRRLGELDDRDKRRLKITGQMMLLEKRHAVRVFQKNYGRGGNNRPLE